MRAAGTTSGRQGDPAWRVRPPRCDRVRPARTRSWRAAFGRYQKKLACQSDGRQTAGMEKFSLDAVAREQARRAAAAASGRSAETVYGGHEHALRQTVLALTAGSSLDDHENPGEATIQVLHGRVRLTAGEVTWEGRSGDLLVVPDARHALKAIEDSAVLLTVSKRIH